jgi:glycine/D-amino acid oxidase-like deaminating enzyme
MEQSVTRIVIVGGGTAGWLSACYLASRLRRGSEDRPSVTVIDAPDIAPIGVGEGTWPTMRQTLSEIGLDEADVLRSCDASLKQGTRFDGWLTGRDGDTYYHPFTLPCEGSPADLVAAWRALSPDRPFAHAVCAQPAVCDAKLAPRQSSMAAYAGALNYAYHLDAAKLAGRLARHAVETLDVIHLREEVVGVEAASDDRIGALRTRNGRSIAGDLFVDCSGHSAILIAGHCGAAWIDRSEALANDRALAVQVPVDPQSPIESQTLSTAHEAGWIWDIGLPTRRGVGCVYASRFMTDDSADLVLRDYVRRTVGTAAADSLSPRVLSFRTGHRDAFWRGNCVGIGLSAGFIEPLEASAIVLIELSLRALADNFPARPDAMPTHAARFNELFRTRWDRIVDFLKLHYLLSRRDEPYWTAQRDRSTVSPRLTELLRLWRDQPPSGYDFPLAEEIFPAASHHYVYYGMGGAVPADLPAPTEVMRRRLADLGQRTRGLLGALPSNRALLNSVAPQPVGDKAVPV